MIPEEYFKDNMTAKETFAALMATARQRKLTEAERTRLSHARQQLRSSRKSVMRNSKKLSRSKARLILHEKRVRGHRLTPKQRRFFGARASGYPVRRTARGNPRGQLIYGQALDITAKKTQPHRCDAACKRVNHVYRHTFNSKPSIYGMPDGSIVIR
jgi:hypothetical protein